MPQFSNNRTLISEKHITRSKATLQLLVVCASTQNDVLAGLWTCQENYMERIEAPTRNIGI